MPAALLSHTSSPLVHTDAKISPSTCFEYLRLDPMQPPQSPAGDLVPYRCGLATWSLILPRPPGGSGRLRAAPGSAVAWMDGWIDGWMDGWMDGWIDLWADGWVDGWK